MTTAGFRPAEAAWAWMTSPKAENSESKASGVGNDVSPQASRLIRWRADLLNAPGSGPRLAAGSAQPTSCAPPWMIERWMLNRSVMRVFIDVLGSPAASQRIIS